MRCPKASVNRRACFWHSHEVAINRGAYLPDMRRYTIQPVFYRTPVYKGPIFMFQVFFLEGRYIQLALNILHDLWLPYTEGSDGFSSDSSSMKDFILLVIREDMIPLAAFKNRNSSNFHFFHSFIPLAQRGSELQTPCFLTKPQFPVRNHVLFHSSTETESLKAYTSYACSKKKNPLVKGAYRIIESLN